MKLGGITVHFPKMGGFRPPPGVWKTKKPGSFGVKLYSICQKRKLQKNSHCSIFLYPYSIVSFCPIWYWIYLWINWLHSYYWSTSVSEKPTKFLPYVFSSYFILIQVYLRNLLVVGNSRISLLLALYLFFCYWIPCHNGAVKNVFNTYNCHRKLDTIQFLYFKFIIWT